jgi:release factor glutamine methyltransferase
MSAAQYIASDDSALLRKALRGCAGGSVLEIGAGNGGNIVDLCGRFDLVVGTEVATPEMDDWIAMGANFVLADSASCLRDSAFDLVAFNPPYLREVVEDRAVDGGADLEVPKRFLRDAIRVVKPEGRIVFLLDQDADINEFERICEPRGFRVHRIASARLFFEELSVYAADRAQRPWVCEG